jgi:hypothetical protein
MSEGYVATERLRWVKRGKGRVVLEQWWAPDVPAYMRSGEGEWREVEVVDDKAGSG